MERMQVIEFMLFLAGIHLMMTLIAAVYRIVDLWYRIDDFAVSILVRLLIPLVIIGFLLAWLEAGHWRAFTAGLVSFAVFHILVFWLIRLVLGLRGAR